MNNIKIYVAHPYTSETREQEELNAIKSIDAGIKVWKKGHIPFIPLLSHWIEKRSKEIDIAITYDEYLKWDLEWLNTCDAILILGKSKGTDIELEEAKLKGKIIYYSVDEIEDNNLIQS